MYQLYGHIQSYLPRYIKGKIFKSIVIDYIFVIKLKKTKKPKEEKSMYLLDFDSEDRKGTSSIGYMDGKLCSW